MNIKQITKEIIGQEITVTGWVRSVRNSKFIDLNDGTAFHGLQVVFDEKLSNFEEIEKAGVGSALEVQGKLVESQGSGQDFELQATEIRVAGSSSEDYPLQKKKHSFEYLREIAHLRSRGNTFNAVFRMRSKLSFAIHQFFQEKNFVYLHSPIISASDCEGAGELFQVTTVPLEKLSGGVDYSRDFFGKKVGLAVSGQLHAEAFALAFKNVYTFGPTFRAENSNTARHASEFWMMEPEIAFADLNADMDLAEEMMKYLINYILTEMPEEMEFFDKFIEEGLIERLQKLKDSKFERITYTEAIEILEKSGKSFEHPVSWGVDLQTEHERYLAEEKFNSPVFVTDYPKDIKAFYMKLNDDGNPSTGSGRGTVRAVDLLVPGVGEIIGGSQREDNAELLEERMKAMGLDPKEYWWYLELRKYGGVPHAGFGLGFERLIMYLSGMKNIRDVIPFPRTPKNVEF